jgi:polyhydroxyalkanoate synthesis regulator phasin
MTIAPSNEPNDVSPEIRVLNSILNSVVKAISEAPERTGRYLEKTMLSDKHKMWIWFQNQFQERDDRVSRLEERVKELEEWRKAQDDELF